MATRLGSLLIELGLDSARFRSGLDRAGRDTNRFQRNATRGFNSVKGALAGMVAGIGVATFATAIRDGLEYASSLGEVASQLGVTTNALQEYRYAGSQAGLTQEQVDQGLARLTRSLGQAANGVKAQAEAFEALGVNIRDANGNVRDAGDIIPDLADGLKRLGSDQQAVAVGSQLMGRGFAQWMPLLADGASGVNNLRNAAHSLGIVLSAEQIQRADDTADDLAKLQTVLKARIAGEVANNANSIVALTQALIDLVTWLGRGVQAWGQFSRLVERRIGNTLTYSPWESDRAEGRRTLRDLNQEEFRGQPVQATMTPAQAAAWRASRRAPIGNTQRTDPFLRPGPSVLTRPNGRTRNFIDDLGDQSLNGAPSLAAALPSPSVIEAIGFAARDAIGPMEGLRDEVNGLLADLFPDMALQAELDENYRSLSDSLEAGIINRATFDEATKRLITGDIASIGQELAERTADITRSVSSFANSIKSGGVLGIVEGLLGLLSTIGSALPGGLNIGGLKFGGRPPAYATGTDFHPGGLAWVGERGRELVNMPRGSQVIANHKLGGIGAGMQPIVINNSALAEVFVDGRVQRAAPAIATAGAIGAVQVGQRRQSRSLTR